jgi:hypothetical protein
MAGQHVRPTNFAVNPTVPETLKRTFPDHSENPVLIVDGRVYENIDPNMKPFLKLTETWSSFFATNQFAGVLKNVTERHFEC